MIKKLTLFFKSAWLCKIVTSLFVGLSALQMLGKYIIIELEGSEAGLKVNPIIQRFVTLAEAATKTLTTASSFICGTALSSAPSTLSVDDAIKALDAATRDLKALDD